MQQAWLNMNGRTAAEPQLRQPMLYKWVAHPLYSGFFLAFWATPHMTAGHLLLAVGMSIYMLIAIRYEERDLHSLFGTNISNIARGSAMITPRFGSRPALRCGGLPEAADAARAPPPWTRGSATSATGFSISTIASTRPRPACSR